VGDEEISLQPELLLYAFVGIRHFLDSAHNVVIGVKRLVDAGVPTIPNQLLDLIATIQHDAFRECVLLGWLWHIALLPRLVIRWL
jgi:hypothetical protein